MAQRRQPQFAIGIPARNEEDRVANSVRAVLASADALDDPAAMRLVVACDSCGDETVDIVRAIARCDRRVSVIEGTWNSSGACRASAIGRALFALRPASLADVWVATTDADTIVPSSWLSLHATHWARGDDAVAGVVDLLDGDDIVRTLFRDTYSVGPDSHAHVHGANVGVRADAYVRVGGFPTVALAEEHALWCALAKAGFVCRSSLELRVATSGRLNGRASGGFADTLRGMVSSWHAAPSVA